MRYNRKKAVEYALKWALDRNPAYYNYDYIGGDCTNYISQCLYSGIPQMNYEKNGWYYINANNKSPSWTGVEFLYDFLIHNQSIGPRGELINKAEIELGDIIQLSFGYDIYGHTLIVTSFEGDSIRICAHTIDSKIVY